MNNSINITARTLSLFAGFCIFAAPVIAADTPVRPNLVLLFIDDMGYGDIGPFGSTKIGATPLPWGMKTECCGAALSITRTDMVGDLCCRILDDAVARGAEAIIVACPTI